MMLEWKDMRTKFGYKELFEVAGDKKDRVCPIRKVKK